MDQPPHRCGVAPRSEGEGCQLFQELRLRVGVEKRGPARHESGSLVRCLQQFRPRPDADVCGRGDRGARAAKVLGVLEKAGRDAVAEAQEFHALACRQRRFRPGAPRPAVGRRSHLTNEFSRPSRSRIRQDSFRNDIEKCMRAAIVCINPREGQATRDGLPYQTHFGPAQLAFVLKRRHAERGAWLDSRGNVAPLGAIVLVSQLELDPFLIGPRKIGPIHRVEPACVEELKTVRGSGRRGNEVVLLLQEHDHEVFLGGHDRGSRENRRAR